MGGCGTIGQFSSLIIIIIIGHYYYYYCVALLGRTSLRHTHRPLSRTHRRPENSNCTINAFSCKDNQFSGKFRDTFRADSSLDCLIADTSNPIRVLWYSPAYLHKIPEIYVSKAGFLVKTRRMNVYATRFSLFSQSAGSHTKIRAANESGLKLACRSTGYN